MINNEYQIVAPKVGEMSQLYRVVKIETQETLYTTKHFTNAVQVIDRLVNRTISEDMTSIVVYHGDSALLLCNSIETASEFVLKSQGLDPSDVVGILQEILSPIEDWSDWRIVEEDDLSIILNDYVEDEC
jgi:hypothetical protein